jgi:hypothetical protein
MKKKNNFCEVERQLELTAQRLYKDVPILECIRARFGPAFFRGSYPGFSEATSDSIIGVEVDKRRIGSDCHGYYISPIFVEPQVVLITMPTPRMR